MRMPSRAVVAGGVVLALGFALLARCGGNPESARFGEPLTRSALESVTPQDRFRRVGMELERRLQANPALWTRFTPTACDVLLLHRHDPLLGMGGFVLPPGAANDTLGRVADAYQHIGLPRLAVIVRDAAAAKGNPVAVWREKWVKAWNMDQVRRAKEEFLNRNLDQVLAE